MKTTALLLVMVLAAATATLAQDLAELEVDHSTKSELVSPHTDWAVPYVQGQARVLFFTNGRGTQAREVVELQQRFDFHTEMVFWSIIQDTTTYQWHGAENGVRRMRNLLAQKWDAFVFLGVPLDLMPVDEQLVMLEAISEGAGLVLVSTDDKRVLKDKNRLPQLPPLLADVPSAAAYTILKGRGARVSSPPSIPYGPTWQVAYDEWAMRLGKAILWAAGKEPPLTIKVTAQAAEVARGSLPGPVATLSWQGAGAGAVAEVIWRRAEGPVVAASKVPLSPVEGSLTLSLPLVRAGEYTVQVIARRGGKVTGLAAAPCVVTSPRQVEAVKLDQDWSEVGGSLSGQVTLSGPAGATEQLRLSLTDRRGREVARQTVTPAANSGGFRFPVPAWFPMLLEVRATLLSGGQEVASAWQYARVTKRHRGQFNFVMWDIPNGNLAPVAEESLARTGVTIHLSSHNNPPPLFGAYDMAWIPYTTDISNKRDEKGHMKPVCWNDEAAVQAHVDGIVARQTGSRQYGTFVYSLGDEIAVRGSCLHPACLAAYRQYLQAQYGTVAALNASWGSQYGSFEEVQLSLPQDNEENEALRVGNFPRWFDRQAFQSDNFCRLCERFGRGFRTLDPQSICGFEGAGTFEHADDLDGFVRANTFWAPYPGIADEVLRSLAPRDFPRANWMGYTKDADTLLEKYWRMITRGCDSVWWWRWETLGRFHGWLRPNFDPYPATREIVADTRIVRDGLGDLLLKSEMQTDGVGILYSLPSAYAAKVAGSPSYGSYESNHAAWHTALRDLGLNFRYFTDRQMRRGELDLKQFKVIILAQAQALDAREAEMLRQYVRQGGLLLADVRPGLFDGHVKPLAAGHLDDVFGIKRTARADAQVLDGEIKVPVGDRKVVALALPRARVDGSVEAAGATAGGLAGKVPLFLTHKLGQGRAVLLNLAMSSYPKPGLAPGAELGSYLLRRTLEEAQVGAWTTLDGAQGQRLRNVEITRWVNGRVQILSLFRHSGAAEAVVVRLPRAYCVYDLKSGRVLSAKPVTEFRTALTPYRAQFFALSPQPLRPASLKVSETVAPGQVQRVRLTATQSPGEQAVKLTVKLPDGRVADWFRPVTLADRKGVTVEVPVALNDPQGLWTVEATDLYTGQTTTAQFRVKE